MISQKTVISGIVSAGVVYFIAKKLDNKSKGLTIFLVALGAITGMVVQDHLEKAKKNK